MIGNLPRLSEVGRAILSYRGIATMVLGLGLVWAYWPTIADLVDRWSHNPVYSHGYLVPCFAVYLLWRRRETLWKDGTALSWVGPAFMAAGFLLYAIGAWLYVDAMNGVALIMSLTGLLALFGGWGTLRQGWPACAFLFFMLPLPFRVEQALGQPLQRVGTLTSTYVLQTLGFPALSEGNVIIVNELKIGVVEACSGLSMLMVFFALATAVILVIQRSWWERLLILASAIPIAIVANVGRITLTTIAYELAGKRLSDVIFHDLAGWLMMPMALLILLGELWALNHLFITVKEDERRHVSPAMQMRRTRSAPSNERRRKSR